jgi:phage baseplate assembly protein W
LIYELDSGTPFKIQIGLTGVPAILQNVRMIMATPTYSCPLDRDFAWAPDLDSPIQVAKERNISRLAAAIRKYEPRAQFVSATVDVDGLTGVLRYRVKISIEEGTT